MRHLCFIFIAKLILYKVKSYKNMFHGRVSLLSKYALVAVLGLSVGITSCKRDNDDSDIIDDSQTNYAEEQLKIEQIYSNADRIIQRAFSLGASALKGGENPLGGCATVNEDSTADPMINRMTIDFGGGGKCVGFDGRSRKGRILVDFTNNRDMKENGYYHKITFDQYVVEGHRVGGFKEVWWKGINGAGNIIYDIASVDTVYLPDNSGRITGASERQREWYRGQGTTQTSDDVFRLTGFGYFIGLDKDAYHVQIHKPLIDAYDCSWINEGVINIFPEGATQRTLDFGESECDNDATIDVNGVVRTAKML